MIRITRLANDAPWTFAIAVTFIFILMVLASSILGAFWPGESYGQYIGGTVGRIISIALLLAVLYRLNWLQTAGFTQPGRWQTWLMIPLPLFYGVPAAAYAMTGSFDFRPSGTALTAIVTLFIFTAAFLEEVAFRGLILHDFVRSWGPANQGLSRSVFASASLFGAMHLVNVLGGTPLLEGLLQGIVGVFLGILFGALVLSGLSIYPAFVLHGLLNWAAYLNQSSGDFASTSASWLLLCVLTIPLAGLGLLILRGLPRERMAFDAA